MKLILPDIIRMSTGDGEKDGPFGRGVIGMLTRI